MAISQVVAAQTNGNLYNTVPPNAAGSGAGGNGGSVAKASNTDLLDSVDVSRYNAGVFGSTVLDNNDADKALSAGTFAYNNQRPVAKKTTTTISGTANDFLVSCAAQPTLVQSIHYQKVQTMGYSQGVRTRRLTSAIREGKWNQYTGQFDSGYPVVDADIFENDNAALPTRDVPGVLTYKTGAPTSVTSNYSEKTG
jgi:hypothetical protein